ncbi:MAG: NAD(P)/FAD-dependent oxidoreductase [Gemmatimonadaceae bacterium]
MPAPDLVVAGAGIIGLCCATAAARRGLTVVLAGQPRIGEASAAAAGMLAPSVEKSAGPAHRFAIASRDFYPSYLEDLAELTGVRVPLNRLGILQVALTEKGVKGLRKTASPESQWVDRTALASLEPTLSHALGAVLNPDDGSVDNVILLAALEELVTRTRGIRRIAAAVTGVSSETESASVTLEAGEVITARHVALAPGAWGGQVAGAPYLAAVTPSRGQLVSYDAIGLRHVTYGPRGYLVPRTAGTLIAGSTTENVGFSPGTTPEGIARVRSAAEEIAPALAVSGVNATWAGLRPVTPDMLPILGPDPENPRIVYACGHSRNGILMAPLTGETVAELVTEEPLSHDLSQFHPARFSG